MQGAAFKQILLRNPRRIKAARVWGHVGIDLLLWGAMLAATRLGWPGFPIAVVGFATFTFRAFGLMHEAVHSAAHPVKTSNERIGSVYGVFCYLPFASWRKLHLDHHYWTGNVEKDPSMGILLGFEKRGYRLSGLVDLSWRYWIPLLGFMQHLVFWRGAIGRKEYGFAVGALAYNATLIYLLGPVTWTAGLVTYLYMVEVFNFPHHLSLEQHHGEVRFPVAEQHAFTRTCVYPRWFARTVLLNFNLHTEHHLFPAHPWYQLDALRAELIETGQAFNVTTGNAWIRSNRRRWATEVFKETFPATTREEKKAA